MDKKELSKILEGHRCWLNGEGGERADLRYADLRGADLRYADLRYANLWGADLRYADLRYANLWGANLMDANLMDANLRYANLRYANLWGADLRYANLRYANLMDANLWGANLMDANLRYANLRGVVGDGERIKSIFIERYPVAYTSECLQIGCERHDITEWMGFDDERILEMDGDTALAWWKKYKGFIKQAIELSPAT